MEEPGREIKLTERQHRDLVKFSENITIVRRALSEASYAAKMEIMKQLMDQGMSEDRAAYVVVKAMLHCAATEMVASIKGRTSKSDELLVTTTAYQILGVDYVTVHSRCHENN